MRDNRGMTLVELCIVIVIMGVLVTIATAGLLKARANATEAAAIASLKAVHVAQMNYAADCGRSSFAISTLVLAASPGGDRHGYLPEEFSSGLVVYRSGYNVTVEAGLGAKQGGPDCNGRVTQSGYYARATPAGDQESGGTRSFAVNQRGSIYQLQGGLAPPEPFGPPATLVQ